MDQKGIGMLLIGHGASQGGGGPVRRLAERLRKLGRFDQVEACFWKETPFVGDAFSLMRSPVILVIPVFATEGRIAKELIPQEMGLQGALTVLPDGRQVHYLHAIGVHPELAMLVQGRALHATRTAGFQIAATDLMLIAHGNKQGGAARESAERLAARIEALGLWARVKALFLEEEPRARDWPTHMQARDIVALPLLLAEGQHAAHDVAPLFGRTELAQGDPTRIDLLGRRIAYTSGLADDEALAGLILRMADEALCRPSRL